MRTLNLLLALILIGFCGNFCEAFSFAQEATSQGRADSQEDGFKPIFDGKTLDGWKGLDGYWSVENATIVGQTTAENPLKNNTFLIWQGGDLKDFELQFQFRISKTKGANSGVQFRCAQEPDGHMIGYQADIDSAGSWLGCLYDEKTGRKLICDRGEKVVINKEGERSKETVGDKKEIFEQINLDVFNDYVIRAVGNHITLTVNGIETVDLVDKEEGEFDLSGLLGLQLHTGPPMKIEFKELRLKQIGTSDAADGDESDDAGFEAIFDGETLAGWTGDEKLWSVVDGAIVGTTTAETKLKANQFLVWSEGEVDNFTLKTKFRVSGTPRANSGIQFRSTQHEDGHLSGYQADIDRSGKFIGITYSEKTGRGILCQRGERTTIRSKKDRDVEKVADPDELLSKINMDGWNEMEVHADGNRMTVKINGNVTSEVIDEEAGQFSAKGVVGLQIHVGPPMKIEFKDIMLKRLKK